MSVESITGVSKFKAERRATFQNETRGPNRLILVKFQLVKLAKARANLNPSSLALSYCSVDGPRDASGAPML